MEVPMKALFAVLFLAPILAHATSGSVKVNNIEIKLFESKLNLAQMILVEKLNGKSRVDQTLVEKAVTSEQGLDQNLSDQTLKFISSLPKSKNATDLKLAIESALLQRNDNKPILYNSSAIQVSQPLFNGRLQCASGSLLYVLSATHQANVSNLVVIFRSGHMLPGVMVKAKGGYQLQGIETTANGEALVDYGPAAKIDTNQIVVSADDYLISKALEGVIANVPQFKQAVIDRAIKRFGLPKPTVVDGETVVGSNGQITYSYGGVSLANASIFAFGVPSAPFGDLERPTFKSMKAGGKVEFKDDGTSAYRVQQMQQYCVTCSTREIPFGMQTDAGCAIPTFAVYGQCVGSINGQPVPGKPIMNTTVMNGYGGGYYPYSQVVGYPPYSYRINAYGQYYYTNGY